MLKRYIAGTLLALFVTFSMPSAIFANETGKKHTTITLGTAAAALLLTHHGTLGVMTGAAAVYSGSKWSREHQHNKRAQAYRRGYQAGRHTP